ncbi:MAG: hypothetical protein K0R66_1308 [Gammaproteobacteria bacterium]|jgi:apolipoprotein N-acyltransferase|nr:hypothetical protein [Gammaproteobacteria bacterium]
MQNIVRAGIVIVLSGLTYYFSYTFWLFMWLAPIPVLVYAYRENVLKTGIVAFLTGLATGISSIVLYWPTHFPVLQLVIGTIQQSLEWTIVILISGYFVKTIKQPISILAYPILLSLLEWAESLGPQGTFNTIAYSQIHTLAIMQIASITGFYGVSFILSLFSSSLAYTLEFYKKQTKIWISLGLSLLVVVSSMAYGIYRIHQYKMTPDPTISTGLVSSNQVPIQTLLNPKLASSLLSSYKPYISQLSSQGAEIVVLPEDSFTVNSSNSSLIQSQLSELAKQNHTAIILGVNEISKEGRFNTAWLFNSEGKLSATYHKQHLVPGVESHITAGNQLSLFNIKTILFGIATCRDMDFSNPANQYGQVGVNIMLVPALDFTVDAEFQTTEPITSGIENGYTVVRSASNGYLSVSNAMGQIVAKKPAINPGVSSLFVKAPVAQSSTFYAKHGNWFAGLLLAMLLLLIAVLINARSNKR